MSNIIQIQPQQSSIPEMQTKSANASNAKESGFSNILENTFQKQPKTISPDMKDNRISYQDDFSEKLNSGFVGQEFNDSGKEIFTAKEFLKKIGIGEKDIQMILQNHGLNENTSLSEFIMNFDLEANNMNDFLDTSITDFLSLLNINEEKINPESFEGKTISVELDQSVSLRDVFQKLGLLSGDFTFSKSELSASNLLKKLGSEKNGKNSITKLGELNLHKELSVGNLLDDMGLEENEDDNIMRKLRELDLHKELSVTNLLDDMGLEENEDDNIMRKLRELDLQKGLSVANLLDEVGLEENEDYDFKLRELNIDKNRVLDLLKKMGLDSDEFKKIFDKSFMNFDDESRVKNLLLNLNPDELKKLAILYKLNMSFSETTDSIAKDFDRKAILEILTGKVLSDRVFSSNLTNETPPIPLQQLGTYSSLMQSSMVGNGVSGSMEKLPGNPNEILSNLKLNESVPRSFFERTVIDQLVSKINFKMTDGQEIMRIRLEPPSLGSIHLKVSVDGKIVNATIVADNNITKDIIQSNLQLLKDSIDAQGLKIDNISVFIGGDGSANRDMDEFRMLLKGERVDHQEENEDNNYDAQADETSEDYYKSRLSFSSSGVNLFV